MKRRTFTIGDIHGGLKALQQLVKRLLLQPADKLIFLGDYVDGWSESAGVIEYLMELEQSYECVFLKGNHDAWCIDWLSGKPADTTWLFHGGKATVESYKRLGEQRWGAHLAFMERFTNYYVDDNNNLFIHAGFSSMHGPEKERYESNYSWDRTLWEMALTMDTRIQKDSALYPKRLLLFQEIYIGHTPTLYYNVTVPMQGCNVWNVDTGAAFHGRLSALDIDTKVFWQSDIVQQLYPDEKGRNK